MTLAAELVAAAAAAVAPTPAVAPAVAGLPPAALTAPTPAADLPKLQATGGSVPNSAPPAPDLASIRAMAAAEERARLLAIDALALKGCEQIVADAKASGAAPGDVAIAIVGKIKADGLIDAVAAMRASAETVPALDAVASETGLAAAAAGTSGGPEKWRADYAASDKLRAEFPTVEAYVATMKREARG